MVERIVDEGIAHLDLNLVLYTGLLMFGLAVIGALGGMSNGFFAEKTVQAFGADLREALFRKVQSFSFGNLDEMETGQLITRLTNDVTQVQEALLLILRILVRAPLLLVGSLIMAIVTSPQLAFLPLVLMPVELVAVVWIINKATPLYTLVQQKLDGLNEVMQENLAGVRVVKAFVRGRHEQARFGHANTELSDQSIQAARMVAVMPAFMMLTMTNHRFCQLFDDHPVFADHGQPTGHATGTGGSFRQTHSRSFGEPTQGAESPGDLARILASGPGSFRERNLQLRRHRWRSGA
jgi:ATP-binding cassette subfamily B protein